MTVFRILLITVVLAAMHAPCAERQPLLWTMAILDRAVYATQPRSLEQQIVRHLDAAHPDPIEGDIYALIVPDSNLLQGGQVSADVFKLLKGRSYETVVVIAPSHSGAFARMSICSVDSYRTPLGTLAVNDRMRHELCDEDDDIYLDDSGHYHTEGIDVQLPYLQTLLKDFDIVPIVMGDESPEFCRELGHAVGEITYRRRTLVIACADILEADAVRLEEFRALFEARDVSRLMGLLNSERVRMLGKGPFLVALIAAMHRHADNVRIVRLREPRNGTPGHIGAVLWSA